MTHPYGERLMVIGFVGDYQGGSDSVDRFLPVLIRNDNPERRLVPTSEIWYDEDDLRPMSESDHEYINPLPSDSVEIVAAGSIVLVAGANLTEWLYLTPGLRGYADRLNSLWTSLGGLYSYRIGTSNEFEELVQGIWNRGTPLFYEQLFKPADERSVLSATTLFKILSNLPGIESSEQVLLHGTYYYETRNPENYELWGESAVSRQIFGDFTAYEKAVAGRIAMLSAPRAHDAAGEGFVEPNQDELSRRSHEPTWVNFDIPARPNRDLIKLMLNSQVPQRSPFADDASELRDALARYLLARSRHRAIELTEAFSEFAKDHPIVRSVTK